MTNPQPVSIYDTTLRDGAQGEGVSFSLQDKLNIARRLAESGIDFIEGGYPLSNEKDVSFFDHVRNEDLGGARVCAFGMTRRRGIKAEDDPGMKALINARTASITLVGKTWDYHATEVLGVSLDENLAMIGESAEFLHRHADVIYDAEHFFDGYSANPAYAIETLRAAASAGATWLALCDTNGGTLPERIAEATAKAIEGLADYDVQVGIHCHNDCELAVANSLAAVDAGARQVQGTINGIGERCGNVDLISVMANLALKKEGYSLIGGSSMQRLTELSRYVYETANLQWRSCQPFVGQSAFAHKGGMHVHAVNKSTRTYEHIDPSTVGNERRILVSELSGRSNIIAVATKHNIDHDKDLANAILAEVVRLENQGISSKTPVHPLICSSSEWPVPFRPTFLRSNTALSRVIDVAKTTPSSPKRSSSLRSVTRSGLTLPKGMARSTRSMRHCARHYRIPFRASKTCVWLTTKFALLIRAVAPPLRFA